MSPIRALVVTMLACLISTAVAAENETLADRDAMLGAITTFFDRLDDGRVLAAYEGMKPFLGVDSAPFEQEAENARQFFGKLRERVGEPIGTDMVQSERIESHFQRFHYLQKFESAALKWTFTFYQPNEGWTLVGVSYSTDLGPLYRRD